MNNSSNLEKENKNLKEQLNKLQKEFSQLTRVKRQLEEVITNIPVVLYVLDKNGVFTLSEGAGLADLDLKPGQVVGLSVFDVYTDYPETIIAHRKALQGKETFYSVKVKGKEKTYVYFDATLKPIFSDKGGIEGVIGIAYNTTYLNKAEKKIAEDEARYRTLINESPIGVLVIQQGLIKFANPAFLSIFGFKGLDEIYDQPSRSYLVPEMRDELSERALRREKGEEVVSSYDVSCIRKDGTTFPAHADARRIIFNDKPSVMLYFRDLSEVKKLGDERDQLLGQLQLSQKLESLGIVAGGVAHDFNNLLFGIMGYANLIKSQNVSNKEIVQFATEIQNISKEAATLTKQMLAYTGKSVLNLVPISLNDVINDIRKLISLSVQKSITITYNLSSSSEKVLSDINQVKQVILNLVINAAESIGDNTGTIKITTGSENIGTIEKEKTHPVFDLKTGKYSFIEITDTGSGIEEKHMNKIFDPFYSTKFTGRGLGLSVVQGIVKAHKGFIEVKSQIKKGTVFRVYFSVTDEIPSIANKRESNIETLQNTGTVLFCDDDENIRIIGERLLRKLSFSTLLASNGLEAVSKFKESKDQIVLVILDVTMPEMTGKEALIKLREIDSDIPIIMSSGYNETDVANFFESKPKVTFIQKPYSLIELQDTITKVLQQ